MKPQPLPTSWCLERTRRSVGRTWHMLSHQVKSHQGTDIAEFTFPKFCVDVIPGTTGEPVCDVHSPEG